MKWQTLKKGSEKSALKNAIPKSSPKHIRDITKVLIEGMAQVVRDKITVEKKREGMLYESAHVEFVLPSTMEASGEVIRRRLFEFSDYERCQAYELFAGSPLLQILITLSQRAMEAGPVGPLDVETLEEIVRLRLFRYEKEFAVLLQDFLKYCSFTEQSYGGVQVGVPDDYPMHAVRSTQKKIEGGLKVPSRSIGARAPFMNIKGMEKFDPQLQMVESGRVLPLISETKSIPDFRDGDSVLLAQVPAALRESAVGIMTALLGSSGRQMKESVVLSLRALHASDRAHVLRFLMRVSNNAADTLASMLSRGGDARDAHAQRQMKLIESGAEHAVVAAALPEVVPPRAKTAGSSLPSSNPQNIAAAVDSPSQETKELDDDTDPQNIAAAADSPSQETKKLDDDTERLLAVSASVFGITAGEMTDLRTAVQFSMNTRVLGRHQELLRSAERTERMRDAVIGVQLQSMLESSIHSLSADFQTFVSGIAKACTSPDVKVTGQRGTDTVNSVEVRNLETFLLKTCLQLDQCKRQLPANADGDFGERLTERGLATSAQHLFATYIRSEFGARLKRYPALVWSLLEALQQMESRLWSVLEELPDSEDTRDAQNRLRSLMGVVLPWSQEAVEAEELSVDAPVPLQLFAEELSQRDMDASSLFTKNDEPVQPSSPGRMVFGGDARRSAIAKFFRHLPNSGRRISFEMAKELLAPAGIVAERHDTEHPWYWVCETAGSSGRAAITYDRADNGFFVTDLVHALFGHNESHGIGDVDELCKTIPAKWWPKERASGG